MSLSCYRRIFSELLEKDGLLVMAPGLGLHVIVSKFLKLYSTSPGVVLIVNAAGDEPLLRDVLQSDGVTYDALPVVVDADMPAPERKLLYTHGGCVFVTSRILVVDLLHGRIERGSASGVLLLHAHRVWEDSLEAWAVCMFKEQNPAGFVKAFSDDPEALTSGFDRLGKVMRAARVPKLYLWPRFQVHMARDLDRHAPEVVELSTPLTPLMVAVQRAIIECLDGCLDELKRSTHVDVSELTRENGLFERFDLSVRRQLQPIWNTLKARTKHVISDLRTLRKLLGYLLRYDSLTFFDFLDKLRFDALQAAAVARAGGSTYVAGGPAVSKTAASPSEWLLSDAGDRLYKAAKARLYAIVDLGPLDSAISDFEQSSAGGKRKREDSSSAACPVTASRVTGHARLDSNEIIDLRPSSKTQRTQHTAASVGRRVGLRFVLERNPKWTALADVLAEVDPIVAGPLALGTSVGHSSGCAVLIAARDDRTSYHLRSVLSQGADALLQVIPRSCACGGSSRFDEIPQSAQGYVRVV